MTRTCAVCKKEIAPFEATMVVRRQLGMQTERVVVCDKCFHDYYERGE